LIGHPRPLVFRERPQLPLLCPLCRAAALRVDGREVRPPPFAHTLALSA
jgi:hypothetical protein